ncbi:MAG: hypothetical protein AB1547_08565, partial [Thermodesulfobacteriota bacterium]
MLHPYLFEKHPVATQQFCIPSLAIRPIVRDRAAEFFRSSEKGSPVTPRLDRDFLTFCGAIIDCLTSDPS